MSKVRATVSHCCRPYRHLPTWIVIVAVGVDGLALNRISRCQLQETTFIITKRGSYSGSLENLSSLDVRACTNALSCVARKASKATDHQISSGSTLSVYDATQSLIDFESRQTAYAKEKNVGMGGGKSASEYTSTLDDKERQKLSQAIMSISKKAEEERYHDSSQGRVMLGFCADDAADALSSLKAWVTALHLPRGLLHGMDVQGVPIDPADLGPVYVKYNTGGALTFTDMRKSGMGFDAIWKPGDAMLESYEGDFRGVHFNVELDDGVFRQFGVLPLDIFD